MNDDIIINEAKQYINSDMTVSETAEFLGISKRTLQLHLKKLISIDPNLHELVLNKQKSNVIAGRSKGGSNGKRPPSYTKEEALFLANTIINNQMTYRDAEEKFNIPSSTIYDMTHSDYIDSELRDSLDIVAAANNRKISTDLYQESTRTK